MAQFDVIRLRSSSDLVLDCQSDSLGRRERRFVVPLLSSEVVADPVPRLTPTFTVAGRRYVMATLLAASLPQIELGERIASLAGERDRIIGALDVLITGV